MKLNSNKYILAIQNFAATPSTAPTRVISGSGTNGKLKGDQVIAKVLAILVNPKVGSLRNMFATYIQNGNTFTFKTPERLIPAFYTATGGNKTQYGKVNEVDIVPTQASTIKHDIESLDFATQVLAEAEEAQIANSMVTAIDAEMDAEILKGIQAAATPGIKYMGGNTGYYLTEDATDADVKKIWRKISFQANIMKGLVTANTVGVSNGQLFGLVSNNLLTLLVEVLKVYTDKNTEVFVEGSEVQGFRVGNITILSHPFLGQKFPAGSLHEKKDYDFSKFECVIMHSEAFAVVFNQAPSMWAVQSRDTGNLTIGTKYQYGTGVLRPAFIQQISMAKDAVEHAKITGTGTGAVISANIPTKTPGNTAV